MICGGGGMGLFGEKKKRLFGKSDEKVVCSANC